MNKNWESNSYSILYNIFKKGVNNVLEHLDNVIKDIHEIKKTKQYNLKNTDIYVLKKNSRNKRKFK